MLQLHRECNHYNYQLRQQFLQLQLGLSENCNDNYLSNYLTNYIPLLKQSYE